MFDWNDEELNIIWGEAGDSDDHIVPYPDQIEEKPPILFGDYTKELNQEISHVTPVEQKKPTTIRTEHGNELECRSKYDTVDPAIGLAPPLLNAGKAHHDSMGPPTSNKMTEISKSCSSKDDMAQLDKESEIFQSRTVGKEECDFVDYGWGNIGSFDDLDRIFSNRDPIFGDPAVGNADELWSSSKDVNNSTMRATLFSGDSSDLELGANRNQSERFETEYLDSSQSFLPEYQNLNEITTAPQDVQASLDTFEHSGGKSTLLKNEKQTNSDMGGKSQVSSMQLNDGAAATDKGYRKKRVLKGRNLEKSKVRQLHDLCGTWSSSGNPLQQFNMQYPQSMLNQHQALIPSQLQRPEPLKHKHSSGPLVASPVYGHMVNQCPTLSVLPQFHPGEGNYNPVCSGYEVSPGNANSLKNSVNAAVKPISMTPQEKIEKLRRRQQMRAIIAIQKQQQKFDNRVSIIENSTMEGGNVEVDDNVTSFASLDPNSPVEQDNSSVNNAVIDDCSVEGSILHRLQETIDKLDMQIRLCIRDSLYRLVRSAKQRQYSSDASSTNPSSKVNVLSKNEGNNSERFARMPDAETQTNPIDRTVAHLLFHRPLDFSGKPAEVPELPVSAKLPYERKATSLMGYFLECSENMQITSPHGSKSLRIFSEGDQSKNSLCLDTSENASNTEVTDEKVKKMKASY